MALKRCLVIPIPRRINADGKGDSRRSFRDEIWIWQKQHPEINCAKSLLESQAGIQL